MRTTRLIEATCPECRGPMTEVIEDGVLDYQCLVEHRYSPFAFLAAHSETQERALWAAALVLEEAAVIALEVGTNLPELRETLRNQAEEKRRQAAAIRTVLEALTPFMTN
jgi:hypothetical protein